MSRYINIAIVLLLALFILGLVFGIASATNFDDDAQDWNTEDQKRVIKRAQSRLKEYMKLHPIKVPEWQKLTQETIETKSSRAKTSVYERNIGFFTFVIWISCILGATTGTLLTCYNKKG